MDFIANDSWNLNICMSPATKVLFSLAHFCYLVHASFKYWHTSFQQAIDNGLISIASQEIQPLLRLFNTKYAPFAIIKDWKKYLENKHIEIW